VGCVPKKVMSNTASIAEALHDAGDYGFDVTVHGFSWPKIKEARDNYVKRLNGIYENNLTKDKVQYIKGRATFVAPNTVQLDNGEVMAGKHVLIATGPWRVVQRWRWTSRPLLTAGRTALVIRGGWRGQAAARSCRTGRASSTAWTATASSTCRTCRSASW